MSIQSVHVCDTKECGEIAVNTCKFCADDVCATHHVLVDVPKDALCMLENQRSLG